jgi:hypothetical protein
VSSAARAPIKIFSELDSGDVNIHSGAADFSIHFGPERIFTSRRNPYSHHPGTNIHMPRNPHSRPHRCAACAVLKSLAGRLHAAEECEQTRQCRWYRPAFPSTSACIRSSSWAMPRGEHIPFQMDCSSSEALDSDCGLRGVARSLWGRTHTVVTSSGWLRFLAGAPPLRNHPFSGAAFSHRALDHRAALIRLVLGRLSLRPL